MSRQGVYVGETARSLFERSGEHKKDADNLAEDSHMVKHWFQQHQDQKDSPKFTFKVVASFSDALTRLVSEAVRIERRGSGILNSKSEFSRCSLPRLTIDVDEWQRRKQEREQAAKVATMEKELDTVMIMDNGASATMLEEKRKFEQVGATQGGRRKKKRKLNILENWGEKAVTVPEDPPKVAVAEEPPAVAVPEEPTDNDEDVRYGQGLMAGQGLMSMMRRQEQKTILEYTVPEHQIRRDMVKEWVRMNLVDLAWKNILCRSWGEAIVREIMDEEIVAGALEQIDTKKLVSDMLDDGKVLLELSTEFEDDNKLKEVVVEKLAIKKPSQKLKQVGSGSGLRKINTKTIQRRGPNKKTLLAKAALSCRKVTSWTGLIVDPVAKARKEAAKRKSEQWSAKNICGGLVKELVDAVVMKSVTGNIMELVVNRAWWEIKCLRVWEWLEEDKALQKTVTKMIHRQEEEEKQRLVEEKKRGRLERKREKEMKWIVQRKERKLKEVVKEEESGLQEMTELLKCMTLMQELECASGMWMTWSSNRLSLSGVASRQSNESLSRQETVYSGQDENLLVKALGEKDERQDIHIDGQHLSEDMEISRDVDETLSDLAGEVVEMEVIEHARLDFLYLELGLEEVPMDVDGGGKFVDNEEVAAHEELDNLLSGQTEVKDDRYGVLGNDSVVRAYGGYGYGGLR